MASMGSVEYVVIAFPGNRFKGEIVPAVAELVDNDVIRILDVAFTKKDAAGNATMFEWDALDDVLEFGFADVDGEAGGVLNDEDLKLAAEVLEPDSSAALIVWEHRWAARVAQAIRDAGGAHRRRRAGAGRGRGAGAGRPDNRLRCQANVEERPAMLLRPFVRNDRPGLIGTMAGTAVVVGLSRRQQPSSEQAAAGRPAAPADPVAQLKELAALKEQGLLTDEEFTAQKALILGR
jgi:hypothetical protein